MDVRFQQLKAGRFHSTADGVFLDSVLVGRVHHELSPKTSGMMVDPTGLQFHNVRSADTLTHRTMSLSANGLVITQQRGDCDLLLHRPCTSLDITVRAERWIEVAQALAMEKPASIPPGLAAIECDGAALDALWRRARWILQAAAVDPGCFERRQIARMVEGGIVWQLLGLLERPLQRKLILPSLARRREAVAKVEAYMEANPAAPLALTDLCRIGGLGRAHCSMRFGRRSVSRRWAI